MPAPKGNKYAIGNKGGRPPKFKNARDLAKQADNYFIFIQGEFRFKKNKVFDKATQKFISVKEKIWIRYPEHATVTGLALYLGFSDRQSLYDYNENEVFSGIIARARARVALSYEQKLYDQFSQGAVFALKNMGWKDKQELDTKNYNYNTEPLTPEKVRELEELKKREF